MVRIHVGQPSETYEKTQPKKCENCGTELRDFKHCPMCSIEDAALEAYHEGKGIILKKPDKKRDFTGLPLDNPFEAP